MQELLELIEAIERTSRQSRRRWKRVGERLDEWISISVKMQEALASMQEAQVETIKSLAATQESLAATQESLAATQESLVATQESLVATQESLVGTQGAQISMQASINRLEEAQASTSQAVLRLRADLDQAQASDEAQESNLGKVVRALNTFVDGYDARLSNVEQRLERLENTA